MKRFVGRCMVSGLEVFDAKVQKLVELFAEHLNSLKGMNKTHRDYFADMFFDDFILNGAQMNMIDAIEFLKGEFDVLGASQNIFTDYSWYKDLEYDYLSAYKKQYQQKKHMFMFAGESDETIRTSEENELLEKAVEQALKFEARCEQQQEIDINEWSRILDNVIKVANSEKMTQFNLEFMNILKKIKNEESVDLAEYPVFTNSFGKTSQYLSFVRK